MERINLRIDGVECGNCARRLEYALSRVTGVEQASITRRNGNAEVVYDPLTVSPEALQETVEAAGFSVIPS